MRSRRWLTERSENDRFDMAYPTGLATFELTTIQLTRVMYAVGMRTVPSFRRGFKSANSPRPIGALQSNRIPAGSSKSSGRLLLFLIVTMVTFDFWQSESFSTQTQCGYGISWTILFSRSVDEVRTSIGNDRIRWPRRPCGLYAPRFGRAKEVD
jgi:hypothetical protein